MAFTVDAFNLAKSRMLGDFNKALSDAEDLRKAETEAGAATARAGAEDAGASGAGATQTGAGAAGATAGAAGDCKPENTHSATGDLRRREVTPPPAAAKPAGSTSSRSRR